MQSTHELLDRISNCSTTPLEEIVYLLKAEGEEEELIYASARDITRRIHGDDIFLRGLIEFSNRCDNNCLYCGIRMGASGIRRYRMTLDEILETARLIKLSHCGTIVLQCGVDFSCTAEDIAHIVKTIKKETGLAVTLSIGTKTRKELVLLKKAGADRILLRFETSNQKLFTKIHPNEPLEERVECIRNMQELGFQVGSGFMIGLPGSSIETIAEDILFTKKLNLDMIGCGPFIPAPGTPLGETSVLTDYSIYYKTMAIIRIMNPNAHIPAATAFDSLKQDGRNEVLRCGANVFMPNFTPARYKEIYALYPKKQLVDTSQKIYETVKTRIESIGRTVSHEVGHALRIA